MLSKNSCFVTTVSLSVAPRLKQDLLEAGFVLSAPPHTLFSGKKVGISCTLYKSGKLTVQGKEKDSFIRYYLEPNILQNLSYSYPAQVATDLTPRMGSDEAGKGDLFGPLCVTALQADAKQIKRLSHLGVVDSKSLSDKKIIQLSDIIQNEFTYYSITLMPQEYNKLYARFGNLNYLLAFLHAKAIDELHRKTKCPYAIVDQFASKNVLEQAVQKKHLQLRLEQRTKGEEDIVVAAASIIARSNFLKGLKKLASQFQVTLPKGAAHVLDAGKAFVNKHGRDCLTQVAKMHFKTIIKLQ